MNKINPGDDYKLDMIDVELINHIVSYPRISHAELAKIVQLSKSSVSQRTKKPAFVKGLRDKLLTAKDLLPAAEDAAIRRLTEIVQTGNDRLAIEAAKVIMLPMLLRMKAEGARNPTSVIEGIIFQTQIGPAGEILQTQKQIKKIEDNIIDVLEDSDS